MKLQTKSYSRPLSLITRFLWFCVTIRGSKESDMRKSMPFFCYLISHFHSISVLTSLSLSLDWDRCYDCHQLSLSLLLPSGCGITVSSTPSWPPAYCLSYAIILPPIPHYKLRQLYTWASIIKPKYPAPSAPKCTLPCYARLHIISPISIFLTEGQFYYSQPIWRAETFPQLLAGFLVGVRFLYRR